MFAQGVTKPRRIETMLRIVLALMTLLSVFGFVHSVSAGNIHVAGVGTFDELVVCDAEITNDEGASPDFALLLTGDLEGCLYTFVKSFECHPGGTIKETGNEIFVAHDDSEDTFSTNYVFTAKITDCDSEDAQQINGRCQHPIVAGSGTGVFEGVKGRLDFKDDVNAGIAIYRGHLNT